MNTSPNAKRFSMTSRPKESIASKFTVKQNGSRGKAASGCVTIPITDLREGDWKGLVRLLSPEPPHEWTGSSLTPDCARRLLKENNVCLLRKSKNRIRGVYPVFDKPEVSQSSLRGPSLGRPKRSGASWTQRALPAWAWREVFYQVLNSCRNQPLPAWSWDQIVAASQAASQPRRRGNGVEMPKRPDWRETLAKRIAA
jgi:hypothetical protein